MPRRRLLGERHPEPRARVHPVRLQLSSRQADAPLLHLQFAIIIAPVNLRPCRSQSYARVFGLVLLDRTRMVCVWRKTSHRKGKWTMKAGVVYPQTELGGDTGAVKAFAQAAEDLGTTIL